MAENKRECGWKFYLTQVLLIAAGACGMWLLGTVKQTAADRLLGNCVMALFGLAITFFHFNREIQNEKLDYDNGEHVYRFLFCIGMGIAVSFVCGFLPEGGWPFLAVFVMLSLFSNMSTGILAAVVLLLNAVLLTSGTAENAANIVALYLICGVFSVSLFRHLEKEFKIGIPLFLSLLCLLVCETANIVLVANARPDFEMFVIPVANMIISSILLLGLLKLFSSMVVFKYRVIYLDINDTETPFLVQMKQENRAEYMHCVHTAYFCERLGNRLQLDVDALKSAAYYFKMGEELEAYMEEKQFPPAARAVLLDYKGKKNGVAGKEAAVLLCADTVVSYITYMIQNSQDRKVDYDKVIDAIFKKFHEEGTFHKCDISVKELCIVQQIFKEEKLYYDFLH